jgi:RNA polymerase sigma factor (sigma-70 family)
MSRPDEQLVAGFLAGDDACIAELIRRYEEPLLRLLRRLTGDADVAEDAAQEAFLAAACGLESLDRPERFRSWLFSIAYRKGALMRGRLKRDARTGSLSDVQEQDAALRSSRSDATDEETPRGFFRKLLDHMNGEDRALLDLRYIDGFGYGDIAAIRGSSPGSIRQRIWRAKRWLLRRMDEGKRES